MVKTISGVKLMLYVWVWDASVIGTNEIIFNNSNEEI